MTCWITRTAVRFGFNDTTNQTSPWSFMNQIAAEEVSGDRDGIAREESARKGCPTSHAATR